MHQIQSVADEMWHHMPEQHATADKGKIKSNLYQ